MGPALFLNVGRYGLMLELRRGFLNPATWLRPSSEVHRGGMDRLYWAGPFFFCIGIERERRQQA
jgi:hypothetical protein